MNTVIKKFLDFNFNVHKKYFFSVKILTLYYCIMLFWISFSSMVRHLDTRAVSTAGMRDLVQFKGYLYPKNKNYDCLMYCVS